MIGWADTSAVQNQIPGSVAVPAAECFAVDYAAAEIAVDRAGIPDQIWIQVPLHIHPRNQKNKCQWLPKTSKSIASTHYRPNILHATILIMQWIF